MKIDAFLISILLTLFTSCNSLSQVSLIENSSNFQYVNGKIILTGVNQDGKNVAFILDSGSNRSFVLKDSSKRISSYSPDDKSNEVEIPFIILNKIKFTRTQFVVADFQPILQFNIDHNDIPIDGVIGADALKDKIIGVDLNEMTITAWNKDKLQIQDVRNFLHETEPGHW